METIPTHKKIPPSKNSERRDFAFSKPRQPRFYLVFFITGLAYKNFNLSSVHRQSRRAVNTGVITKTCHNDFNGREFSSAEYTAINFAFQGR